MPKKNLAESESHRLPLLPLKDMVVFPRMVVPLLVGRPSSLAAVESSLSTNQPLFLCAQKDASEEAPSSRDMYRVGVAANVLQTLRMPDGTCKVVVEGLGRGKVNRFFMGGELTEVMVRRVEYLESPERRAEAVMRSAVKEFEEFVRVSQRVAPEILVTIQELDDADALADTICAYLPLRVEERQNLLEIFAPTARLEKIIEYLMRENEMVEIERHVRERVRDQFDRGQREHFLQEQLKIIHQELGNRDDSGDEFGEMREMIAKSGMPKVVREKAEREFSRYERMPMLSPESVVIRTYLETLCEIPWKKRTRDALDLKLSQEILDRDHYGLSRVKERILEFLAVRQLRKSAKGPILCLVGPPGVGKTSLGESIAEAMKRKFVRVALGGIRDEAEIRGHRRTYIGALPGRVIQSLVKVGVKNPVFMLDEIDKMATDFRGDPASALLEVLDPAQNKAFSDHYLEVDVDLSEVFFIATANNEYDIPYALHDRMEVVRLPGYTLHEKEQIARRYLLPRQIEDSGLKPDNFELTVDGLDMVVQRYTQEAGVRELERQIAALCRKVARKVVLGGEDYKAVLDRAAVQEMLGPPIYSELRAEAVALPGVATGMAWTQAGGDILTVETTCMPGKGRMSLTGRLGEVMKESAEAAFAYIRANASTLKVPADFFKKNDIHVHVPEGAIPKDGPSAGVALVVSMLSAMRNKAPADRLAMTGEITLRGRVLAVGGIKEKVIAAHRGGIRQILMPKENEKDFPDIPAEVRDDIRFVLLDTVGEALAIAFPDTAKAGKKPAPAKGRTRPASSRQPKA
jgi:ATP-dependent Lon protease